MRDISAMHIRNLPIRFNLGLLTLLASGLAVLLAAVGFSIYESQSLRASASREVTALADSLGTNCAASLAFNDPQTAREMLGSLATEPHVLAAMLYNNQNQIFVSYDRSLAASQLIPHQWRSDGIFFNGRDLKLYRGVYLDGERVGTIAIAYDLSAIRTQLVRYGQIAAIVLFLSFIIAFLISFRLAHSIAEPLRQLAGVAQHVTSENDYSVRAHILAGGETGLLIDSFNRMLLRIESRELALRESEERYALAARGANDGLWDWNLITNEIYFSPRWSLMLGYSENERWTTPEEWFNRIHPMDRERVRAEIEAHCEGKTTEINSDYRMQHKAGSYIWALSRGIAVRNQSGKAIRIAGSQTDITEGKVADPLTQMPNRLYFMDRLESALESLHRSGTLIAVLFIDLDGFKLINDSLGHAAGDELLVNIAGRLRGSIRISTRHGEGGHCVAARMGGDEFAVLLGDVPSQAETMTIATRILERINEPIHFDGRRMFVSASIGIALSSSASTPEELLRNADTAMYAAKSAGKGRIEFYNDGMRERAISRFELETDLHQAIKTNQLVVHYQPIYMLSSDHICGFEALVRWKHPERGLIPPVNFIPIAEESDLIISIGRKVLHESCRQMAKWQREFPSAQPLTIAVNVSPRQLNDSRLVEDIEHALAESGLNPESLELELTESAIIGNNEQIQAVLHRLKAMKIKLAIDDFGTGYSSLNYLRRLPFDTLKVDRSFVTELDQGNGSTEVIKAVLQLARSLKLEVITEGVETGDQLQTLRKLGAKFVQGFLFSRPVDAQEAGRLYSKTVQTSIFTNTSEMGLIRFPVREANAI
jgi:diguanylate cyclase (GGDEF)-like protein/PAS domain S-box-containing protein